MKRYVICAVDVEGFHRWPEAPDSLNYLRNRHRHIFQIRMEIPVSNNDREIEIIQKQHQISSYLKDRYSTGYSPCEFGSASCEQIAQELLEFFHAASCTVLEDGYGGAKVVR